MLPGRWVSIGVCALLMLSGCREAEDRGGDEERRVEPPTADVSGLDPAVRKQIEEAVDRTGVVQGMVPPDPVAVGGAFGHLGMLYETYSFHDAAEEAFSIAKGFDPGNFKWSYLLGLAHRSQGKPELSMADFDEVNRLTPDYWPARVAAGQLRLDMGRFDEAEGIFSTILKSQPNNPPALAGMGKVAYARKDWAGAVAAFERVLEIQPEADALHYSLGLAYRGLGDKERAKVHLDRRGKVDPYMRDPVAAEMGGLRVGTRSHEHRGVDAGKRGNLDLAVEELEKAVTADPENASARTNLGTAYALAGELEKAMEQYASAVALNGNDRRALCNFAVVLAKQGRWEEARERFRGALEIDPDYCDAHIGYAAVLGLLGEYVQAAEHFREGMKADPENRAAILGLMKALCKVGEYAEARGVLMQGRKVHPKSMVLAHALARFLAACPEDGLRDGATALSLANSVVSVRSTAEHAETLAMALAEVGNFVDAIRVQREAVAMWERSGDGSGNADSGEWGAVSLELAKKRLGKYESSEPCRDPGFRFEQFDGAVQSGKQ